MICSYVFVMTTEAHRLPSERSVGDVHPPGRSVYIASHAEDPEYEAGTRGRIKEKHPSGKTMAWTEILTGGRELQARVTCE